MKWNRGVGVKKAGDFLRSIKKSDTLIKRKTEQLERLRSMAEYRSPVLDGIGGSNGKDVRGEMLAKIVDIEKELDHDISQLLENRMRAMKMIDSLSNPDMVSIMYMRYLDYRSWQEISFEVGKTIQWVLELNRRGLRELESV